MKNIIDLSLLTPFASPVTSKGQAQIFIENYGG